MKELEDVFLQIKNKYVNLLHYVNEYEILFAENKELDTMISETKSSFFSDLYWLYWNFITIQTCALMDKKIMMGKENLTIPKLIDLIEKLDFECTSSAKLKLETINEKIGPFKVARNKAFGHYDLESVMSKKEFDRLELDDLKIIFNSIEGIFNLIEVELGQSTKLYGFRIQTGAMRLLNFIRLGIEKKKEIINRRRQ
ncbi:hypothetical protein M9Q43_13460 [Flavobacterium sp. HXWNR29]|uniref:AbiU2 domain-containing protein n=1 Tax=Flavobacterium odoriferum TaxID=2946604 RepID=UPI0021CAF6D4|nr:hypothetical protein [Flavobacterium sp. HXWNR29]MCU4190165.1 hypothetical protein [Flavobacterium sp. HXWNR29]